MSVKKITAKIISWTLTLAMVLSFSPATMALADEAQETMYAAVPAATAATAADREIRDGVILHAFDWRLSVIEDNLQAIADAGYTAIQTSPVHGGGAGGGAWSSVYQPRNMLVGGSAENPARTGTKEEFESLCAAADALGIKIIVDVVSNHMNRSGEAPWSTTAEFFHQETQAVGYGDRYLLTQPNMISGLPDLNTQNPEVQAHMVSYIEALVAAGADGFRYDAIKHIELDDDTPTAASIAAYEGGRTEYPDGEFAGEYVKKMTTAAKNALEAAGKVNFQYGEVLQGGNPVNDRMQGYSQYVDLTASQYGHSVRSALEVGEVGRLENWSDYDAEGLAADRLVPWVESHDTFNNEGESVPFSPKQIRQGWAMIAARKDAAPLFLARNVNADGSRNSSVLTAENVANSKAQWTHPEVVAINQFHNSMDGTEENLVSLGYNAVMIERGTAQDGGGAVLLNVSAKERVLGGISVAYMEDGVYVNALNPKDVFVVTGGKLRGTIPGNPEQTSNLDTSSNPGLVVLMERDADSPALIASRKTDSVATGNDIVDDAGVEVVLSAVGVTNPAYSVNNAPATPFSDGQEITVGANANYGDVFTLILTGTVNSRPITSSYSYTRVEPEGEEPPPEPTSINVYFSTAYGSNYVSWVNGSGVRCYVFNPEQLGLWPGSSMTRMKYNGADTQWWRIEIPYAPVGGVIFNGDNTQTSSQNPLTTANLQNEQSYFYGRNASGTDYTGPTTWDAAFAAGNGIGFASSVGGVFPPGRNGVIFNTGVGGTEIANQYLREGEKAVQPANPARPGYVFDGSWYTDELLTTPYDFDTPVENTLGEDAIYALNLYAGWIEQEADKFKVDFDTQGGGPVLSVPNVESGAKVTAPANPVKAGYTFVGWFTEEDGNTQWDFDSDTVTADVTLYAKWTMNTYTITYRDGASTLTPGPASYTAQDLPLGLPVAPAKTGQTFQGWYTNSQFLPTSKIASIASGTAENLTLYARYTPNSYTITLSVAGAVTDQTSLQVSYGGYLPVVVSVPKLSGRSFLGFYDGSGDAAEQMYDANGLRVNEDPWTSETGGTFYARYDDTVSHPSLQLVDSDGEPLTELVMDPGDAVRAVAVVTDGEGAQIANPEITWAPNPAGNGTVRVSQYREGVTPGGMITAIYAPENKKTVQAVVTATYGTGADTMQAAIQVTVRTAKPDMVWAVLDRTSITGAQTDATINHYDVLDRYGYVINQTGGSRDYAGWTFELESSNTAVATVPSAHSPAEGGATITAVGPGVTTITVKASHTSSPDVKGVGSFQFTVDSDAHPIAIESKPANVTASIYPQKIGYDQNAVLKLTGDLTSVKSAVVDNSVLGAVTAAGAPYQPSIDLANGAITLYVKEGWEEKEYEVPVTVTGTDGSVITLNPKVTIDDANPTVPQNDFDWDEAIIYFMLTDRFYDGDPSNNNAYDRDEYQPDRIEAHQGGDLKGVLEKLDYLEDLGVNTIWITPIVQNTPQMQHKESNQSSYHGYWATDFTQIDPHLGTMDDLDALLDGAAQRGINIMVDIVLNHSGYYTGEEETNFEDMIRQAYTSSDQLQPLGDGWIRLPDFKTEDPEVRQQLTDWQLGWIDHETAAGNRISYFRIDTIKHADNGLWQQLKNKATEENPNFKMIGEDWTSPTISRPYLFSSGADALLDFDWAAGGNQWIRNFIGRSNNWTQNISPVTQYNNIRARSAQMTNYAVMGNHLSNHDFNTLLSAYNDTYRLPKGMLAASVQLTSKGIPVIYYGEELMLQIYANSFNEPSGNSNRRVMKWDNYTENELAMLEHYKKMLEIRNENSALFTDGTYGEVLAGTNATHYVVYPVTYEDETLFVGINANDTVTDALIPTGMPAGTELMELYGETLCEVDADGNVSVAIPAAVNGGTVVLKATGEVAEPTPVTFTATQQGGADGTADSTGIEIQFSAPVTGLSDGDVTITNGTGEVTKGELSGEDDTYTIALDAVAKQGDVTVAVADFGDFDVTTSALTVAVYKNATPVKTEVTFTAVQQGGAADTANSTGIEIQFSAPVTGLSPGDVTITNGTGEVTKGALSGEGDIYTIALGAVAKQGEVTVAVADFGNFDVTTSALTVAVYKKSNRLISITTPVIGNKLNGAGKTAEALGLPTQVTIVTEEGEMQAEVTWDVAASSYDPALTTEQTFTVNGEITLPNEVVQPTEPISLAVSVSVTVNAAVEGTNTITSIKTPDAVSVDYGAEKSAAGLKLPATVTIETLGGEAQAEVTWDVAASNYDTELTTEQTFTVNGEITLPNGVEQPEEAVSLAVSIEVTVRAAVEERNTIISITTPDAVSVDYGAEKSVAGLGLPAQVTIVTDEGEMQAEVTWDVAASSYDTALTTEQTFTVNGEITLPNEVVQPADPISLAVSIAVTVRAAATALSSDATLSALTVSSGTLTPAFAAATDSYTVNVSNSVSSITLTAAANHEGASVAGDGSKTLSVGANTFTILVTAEDGEATKTYTVVVTRASAPPVTPSNPSTSGGSSSGGTVTTTPAAEPETVTALPTATVTAAAANEETAAKAETAVATAAEAAAASTGKTIAAAGPAVTVAGTADTSKITTITLPDAVDSDTITTMAVLNDDGTLTPVPTVVNEDGTVTALVTGSATLVPLNVEANFTDLNYTPEYAYVAEEINKAAAMMIIEGRGNGVFDPNAQVTTQESVTMFLRAVGVPVQYETALTTGQAHGLNSANAVPTAPTTRIDAAELIVNALKDVGMKPTVSEAETAALLAQFSDVSALSAEERQALAICVKLGIFKGYGNGTIGPKDLLLRSHMASLSVRLQNVILGK
jgi:uncharacterized repeat protein (TIGR02543 family)